MDELMNEYETKFKYLQMPHAKTRRPGSPLYFWTRTCLDTPLSRLSLAPSLQTLHPSKPHSSIINLFHTVGYS